MSVRIVVTGPESSGKTSLCTYLSSWYKGTMIPEYARTYLRGRNREYSLAEVEHMGERQVEMNRFENSGSILFCDTDALTCAIWAQWKWKVQSGKLEALARSHVPDFYLLCMPDLPWEFDPLRENPREGLALFKCYLERIAAFKVPYAIIDGVGVRRKTRSRFFMDQVLVKIPTFDH